MPSFRKLDVRVTTLDGDLKTRGGGKKPRDHRDQQKDYTHKLEEYGVHGYTKGNAPSCIAFIESVTDMVFRITIKPELPFDEAFRDDSVASTEHVKHEEDIKREEEYDQDMISLRTGQPMRPAARKARDTWRAEHEAMRNLMPGYDRHGRYIGRKGKDYGGPSATYLAGRRDHGLDAASNHPTSDPGYYGGNEDDHMEEDRLNIKHESSPARDPYFKQERTDEDDDDFTYDVNEPTPSPRGSSSPAAPAPKAKWHLLASLYLDGRKVPERQTMIYLDRSHEEFKLDTDGEITMRSRWVKNRDGTISSMAWVFADVGVETMLDKLLISAADAAANTNDEDDIASALETAALDQREEEQAKPQMGQIVVVFERVTVTQTFEDEEYTGGRYVDEFDDASGKKLDKDVTHTAAFRQAHPNFRSVVRMVHYTEYVANDPPYATFRFFYRSRKTLAKMGFIKPPAQPKTMANRRNMNTQLQSITPLSVANPLALNPLITKTGLVVGLLATPNLTVFDPKVKRKPREATTRPKLNNNIVDLLGIDSMDDDDSNGEDDDVSSNLSTRATTGTLTPNPPLPPTSKPNLSPGSMFASDYDPHATVDPKLLAVDNPSFSSTHTSDTEILPPEQRVGYRDPDAGKLMHELKTPMTGKFGAPTTTSYSTSIAKTPFGGGGGGDGAYDSHSFRIDRPAEEFSDNEADDEGERPRGRSFRRRGSAAQARDDEEDIWGSYPYGSLSVGAGTDDDDGSLYDGAMDNHGLAGDADDEGLGDRLGRVELGKKRDRDEGEESGAGAGADAGDSGAGTVRFEDGRNKVGEQAAEEMAPKKKMMRLVANVGATEDGAD